eukprot:364487-Chlamydomonas_euryale.AAC.20
MSAPMRSSSSWRVARNSGTSSDMCRSAAPPPGTMPSSTAANVAFFASSMRSLRSSSSVSVAAPTYTDARAMADEAGDEQAVSVLHALLLAVILGADSPGQGPVLVCRRVHVEQRARDAQ